MEIDEQPLIRTPEKSVKRDVMGRFDRRGSEIKNSENIKRNGEGKFLKGNHGGPRAGAGRPPGAKNKTSLALKEAILGALEAAGGKEGSIGYLRRLAIENSSAFASLLGKVLPTTLAASESDGGRGTKITFERVIVYPDGRRHIQGVTPKQQPVPEASHALPNSGAATIEPSEIN
jgi:hypothetical protein